MENITPGEARDALEQADAARRHMSAGLRLPSYFHASLGAAIAVQVGTLAGAIAGSSAWPTVSVLALAYGGAAAFLAVAWAQLWRFRRLNGASVRELAARAVFGTSTTSSTIYAAGLVVSAWAALGERWWLLVVASLGCGAGYAEAGRRWWEAYRRDPRAEGSSRATLIAYVALALGALVVLVMAR